MYEKDFAPVERVFQFSCDEVCIKLKSDTAVAVASKLSAKIQDLFKKLQWQSLLPLRIEMFELCRIPFVNINGNEHNLNYESEEGQFIHTGHSTLRESTQFVDLPAVHDPAWVKENLEPLSGKERCDDSYFIRRVYGDENDVEDSVEIQLKKLPRQMRPRLILDHMKKRNCAQPSKKKANQFSSHSKEFIPVGNKMKAPENQNSKAALSLSKDALPFMPSTKHSNT